jgi:hypothetical protein
MDDAINAKKISPRQRNLILKKNKKFVRFVCQNENIIGLEPCPGCWKKRKTRSASADVKNCKISLELEVIIRLAVAKAILLRGAALCWCMIQPSKAIEENEKESRERNKAEKN